MDFTFEDSRVQFSGKIWSSLVLWPLRYSCLHSSSFENVFSLFWSKTFRGGEKNSVKCSTEVVSIRTSLVPAFNSKANNQNLVGLFFLLSLYLLSSLCHHLSTPFLHFLFWFLFFSVGLVRCHFVFTVNSHHCPCWKKESSIVGRWNCLFFFSSNPHLERFSSTGKPCL